MVTKDRRKSRGGEKEDAVAKAAFPRQAVGLEGTPELYKEAR